MKNLLIRNLKLRKWTIVLYAVLLVISPLQLILNHDTLMNKVIYSALVMVLVVISVLDSGHVFRFNKKLGHTQSYDFFASLPFTKLLLFYVNYITVLLLFFI